MVQTQFSEQELVNLTLAIVAIDGANPLNISVRTVPGSHRDGRGVEGRGAARWRIANLSPDLPGLTASGPFGA
jgi:hypothetical protein